MKYTKKLLTKETKNKNMEEYYGKVFETLNNEKTLEEYTDLLLSQLTKVEGNIHVVRQNGADFEVVTDEDNENKTPILESETFKRMRDTKKPYFHSMKEGEGRAFYAGFPLNFKGRLIGGLIIEKEQKIKQWKEIYVILHMLVFAFRFYELLEIEREVGVKDVTTKLYNEKYFYNHFELEESRYRRFKDPMTVVLLRLKNYADINDKYGYNILEKVLCNIGNVLKHQSRKIDTPAKLDKDTFAILLSNTPEKGGEVLSTRIKMTLENEVKIDGKKVPLKIGYVYGTFQAEDTKESFLEQLKEKIM